MAVMIDNARAIIPYHSAREVPARPLKAYDEDGVLEWETGRPVRISGRFGATTMSVRARPPDALMIAGNPSKFLQGHNLFGSDDLVPLMAAAIDAIVRECGLTPTAADRRAYAEGDYRLTRLDIARSYDLGTPALVRQFLALGGRVARGRHQAVSAFASSSIYLGKNSKRSTLLLYDKGDELRKNPPPKAMPAPWAEQLLAFAPGKLRAEVSLKATELADRGLNRAARWTPELAGRALDDSLARLELHDTLRLPDEAVDGLSPRLLGAYEMWRAGRDLRAIHTRSAFSRLRTALKRHGIDIAAAPPSAGITPVEFDRPLRDFITGPGVPPPDWAVGTPLLALSGSASVAA